VPFHRNPARGLMAHCWMDHLGGSSSIDAINQNAKNYSLDRFDYAGL
jgi:hypothetical protein